MNAIVCVKQVLDTEAPVKLQQGQVVLSGMPMMANVFDEYAIEEALLWREKLGGKVTVISMGPPQAMDALKEAVAMGCDAAVLLSDRAFAGADTWATAYTLSQAIRKLGDYDLIFCGKQAIDGDTGQVGPGIARQLGIPQLTYVFKIPELDLEKRAIRAERLLEEGREVVTSTLPALVTVVKDINQPRYPTVLGIRRATRMTIPIWTAADLAGADASKFGLQGSPTQVIRIFTPPPRAAVCEMIAADSAEEAAAALAERLLAEKVI